MTKTVDGVVHTYLYAGGKLLRETYGNTTLDFFYDANGNPFALKLDEETYYYITNLQGDVLFLVDADGETVAEYTYDPYGKVLTATGTLANTNPLRYRGYYYDTETGFYYLQSRYYDPTICRFINADDYASTGQGIIGSNMFAYCNNGPVCYEDSVGSMRMPCTVYINDTGWFGQHHALTTNSADAVNYGKQAKNAPLNKYGDSIKDIIAAPFFDEKTKKRIEGISDIESGTKRVVKGTIRILKPDLVVSDALIGVAQITWGTLEFAGGIAKVVIGVIKNERK